MTLEHLKGELRGSVFPERHTLLDLRQIAVLLQDFVYGGRVEPAPMAHDVIAHHEFANGPVICLGLILKTISVLSSLNGRLKFDMTNAGARLAH